MTVETALELCDEAIRRGTEELHARYRIAQVLADEVYRQRALIVLLERELLHWRDAAADIGACDGWSLMLNHEELLAEIARLKKELSAKG